MANLSLRPASVSDRTICDLFGFQLSLTAAINDRKAQALLSNSFDLSLGEWRVLGMIKAYGAVAPAELARALYQDKGQLSRTIKSLVNRGLVMSKRSDQNGMRLALSLTAEGRRRHDRIFSFAWERNQQLIATLSSGEASELFRLLAKVRRAAEDVYERALSADDGDRRSG